jgi:DNA polymerase III subunit epsilon
VREIILDTETTGLDPAKGDRIVEIGAVELVNHLPSGETYHCYINPERAVPSEAAAVHGLTTEFLKSYAPFAAIASGFIDFIADTPLIIHNASFDIGFLNAELALLGREPIDYGRVIDTLKLARQRFPMGPNSLDGLCRRFAIDNSRRTKHGALLDSELLAEVYLELIGGRQTALALSTAPQRKGTMQLQSNENVRSRPASLPPRLTEEELSSHAQHIADLGPQAVWTKLSVAGKS